MSETIMVFPFRKQIKFLYKYVNKNKKLTNFEITTGITYKEI